MEQVIHGRAIVSGRCSGLALVSPEPFSFWGGYDPQTGTIVDRRLALQGSNAAGRVLVVPGTRGSSTTTAILLEAIRAGTAPVAILTQGIDPFLALAAVVAEELYGKVIPITAVAPDDFGTLRTGDAIRLEEGGLVIRNPGSCPVS